jgi:hypothetical protein
MRVWHDPHDFEFPELSLDLRKRDETQSTRVRPAGEVLHVVEQDVPDHELSQGTEHARRRVLAGLLPHQTHCPLSNLG